MKYQWTIILIGVLTILFPFLHLPLSWEIVLQVTLGIVLILTGVAIQQSRTRHGKKVTSPHTESSHHLTKKTLHTPLADLDASLHARPIDPEKQIREEHDDGEIFS